MDCLNWDPGGTHDIKEQLHLIIADLDPAVCSLYIDEDSCIDIDSRANIPVMGKHSYSMADTGQTSDVNAFTPDHKKLVIHVVDEAIK